MLTYAQNKSSNTLNASTAALPVTNASQLGKCTYDIESVIVTCKYGTPPLAETPFNTSRSYPGGTAPLDDQILDPNRTSSIVYKYLSTEQTAANLSETNDDAVVLTRIDPGNLQCANPPLAIDPLLSELLRAKCYIDVKYNALAKLSGFMGDPISNVSQTPDGQGFFRDYEGSWSIYWSQQTGAHELHGDIRLKYLELLSSGYSPGLPITDETITPDGVGRYNHFQYGSIFWTPNTGAHEIHGAIRDKWANFGWEVGYGYPTTDETVTPDGIGRYNYFSNGGSIYWTPQTGAHEIHGDIWKRWADLNWEKGYLGYPITDEILAENGLGRYNQFQYGYIYWEPCIPIINICYGTVDQPSLQHSYSVRMDKFTIYTTRALNDDTDHIVLAAAVGARPPVTATRFVGDVDDGEHTVNMEIGPFTTFLGSQDKLYFAYLITNKGEGSASDLANIAAGVAGALGNPAIGSAIKFASFIGSLIAPGWFVPGACDGPVAWLNTEFDPTFLDWITRQTHSATFTQRTLGTDSSTGCGSNSVYDVTYTITRIS